MTEPKRNPNPFIRMAQEAKQRREEQLKSLPGADGKMPVDQGKKAKPNKGFGGPTVVRRSGRGG